MLDSIFLDRDGVINVDFGYVHETKNLVFVNGVLKFLKQLPQCTRKFIVTNQAGIARGFYSEKEFTAFMSYLYKILATHDVCITDMRYCTHHPDFSGECMCRKPKPGMLLELIRIYHVDVSSSMMIGDKLSDCEAGYAAGVKYNVLLDAHPPEFLPQYIYQCSDFAAIERLIESINAHGHR